MQKLALLALGAAFLVSPAFAKIEPFPPGFKVESVDVNGTKIYVRIGGTGPAVLLLHGFGDTGDMWQPVAAAMMKDHTVVVPDLRGMGFSGHPDTGYDKKNEAVDVAQVLDHLKVGPVQLVTHDIGNMVGYAFAAQYPARVQRWIAIDAPLPGIDPIWAAQLSNPKAWHFNFHGPDEERLVAGRERIYLDRFYNELSANPATIDEATRQHYAKLYAMPHAIHDAFEQFKAFPQDGVDNQAFLAKGKLAMPVLAVGAEKSYGTVMADDLRMVATDVTGAVVPNSGHWIMEENPAATTKIIVDFLK